MARKIHKFGKLLWPRGKKIKQEEKINQSRRVVQKSQHLPQLIHTSSTKSLNQNRVQAGNKSKTTLFVWVRFPFFFPPICFQWRGFFCLFTLFDSAAKFPLIFQCKLKAKLRYLHSCLHTSPQSTSPSGWRTWGQPLRVRSAARDVL